MRVVIAGLGSIGRRHLSNMRALEPDAEIAVVRHTPTNEVPEGADTVTNSLDRALAHGPDVVFVCGPTATHAAVGVAAASVGAHLFVEKPLAADAVGARAIVDAARENDRQLIVGYNLRFSPSLRVLQAAVAGGAIGRPMSIRSEVGQYLPDWRPGTDYRQGNTARAELGGNLVFELSHEIDYVRWLCGEIVHVDALLAKLSDLELDIDDTAEMLVRFASGAIGSIHMDLTQRSGTRTARIIGTDGTLTWDGIAGTVMHYGSETGWTALHADAQIDRNAMYIAEMRHVFACVRGTETPLVTGLDGVRVVEIAQAAVDAGAAHAGASLR